MKPAYNGNVWKRSRQVPFYTAALSMDSRDCKGSPLKTDFRYARLRLGKVSLYKIYFRIKFKIPAYNSSFPLITPNVRENIETTATVLFYFLQTDYLYKCYKSVHYVLSNITLHYSGAHVAPTIRASAMFLLLILGN